MGVTYRIARAVPDQTSGRVTAAFRATVGSSPSDGTTAALLVADPLGVP